MNNKQKREFGDFQTPIELARKVCSLLSQRGFRPATILEPSCGEGSFLQACLEHFTGVQSLVGIDINEEHVQAARTVAAAFAPTAASIKVMQADFFHLNWPSVLESMPQPILVIGNPPWITNAELGSLKSSNLPDKSNYHDYRGIDAITGKGNFDISEWLLNRAIEWIDGGEAVLAMLCKTSVARKALHYAWKRGQHIQSSDMYAVDALTYFGASVPACLLVVCSSASVRSYDCSVHDSIEEYGAEAAVFGLRERRLVASIPSFERWKHLEGEERYKWRSGIKHDCAKVMEFSKEKESYRNGFGELVDLEDTYLFPLLKSSDIANSHNPRPSRWMLVTQQVIGENTDQIRRLAPQTWKYLQQHADLLSRRASSVYHNRPKFSVFGVGDYSFAPWKVAISGFYKNLAFSVVGPHAGKPAVLDDTCYFLVCRTEDEAGFLARLVNSEIATDFFSAFIFWDHKRPITLDILRRLDLLRLAQELNVEEAMCKFLELYPKKSDQPMLFSQNVGVL
ncbi:MAG: methyltransferase domain-containing protein [Sedimentisphaerales bacterium]|nr:methyltransferase domain-containing protein [Sedimentisphaerales bacterium]